MRHDRVCAASSVCCGVCLVSWGVQHGRVGLCAGQAQEYQSGLSSHISPCTFCTAQAAGSAVLCATCCRAAVHRYGQGQVLQMGRGGGCVCTRVHAHTNRSSLNLKSHTIILPNQCDRAPRQAAAAARGAPVCARPHRPRPPPRCKRGARAGQLPEGIHDAGLLSERGGSVRTAGVGQPPEVRAEWGKLERVARLSEGMLPWVCALQRCNKPFGGARGAGGAINKINLPPPKTHTHTQKTFWTHACRSSRTALAALAVHCSFHMLYAVLAAAAPDWAVRQNVERTAPQTAAATGKQGGRAGALPTVTLWRWALNALNAADALLHMAYAMAIAHRLAAATSPAAAAGLVVAALAAAAAVFRLLMRTAVAGALLRT